MRKMRIITVSKQLDLKFRETDNIGEAEKLFKKVFFECVQKLDKDSDGLLGDCDLIADLRLGRISDHTDFLQICNKMDDKYFNAEERGQSELSQQYFSLARLMAALSIAKHAKNISDFSEASYEAIMSLKDPQVEVEEFIY